MSKKRTGITFKLDKDTGKIVMQHCWRKQRKQYAVNLPHEILPTKHWNNGSFWHPNEEIDTELNAVLSKYKRAMRKTEIQLSNLTQPDSEEVAKVFWAKVGMVTPDDVTLKDELQAWLTEQDTINEKRKQKGSVDRHLDYPHRTSLRQALKEFDDIKIKLLDSYYIQRFKDALEDGTIKTKFNKPYAQKSKISVFTAFNKFVNETLSKYRLGFEKTTIFKIKHIKKASGKYQVAFTLDELDLLRNLNVDGRDEYHRDLLLILCLTGARYCDGYKFDERIISGNSVKYTESKQSNSITLKPNKDDEKGNIQISQKRFDELIKLLKGIREKKDKHYKWEQGTGHNGNEFRDNIKKLSLKAGITKEMNLGKDIYCLKYEAVGNHTGRRTFIYHAIEEGMRFKDVKKLCGHKRVSQTEEYYDKIKI